VKICSKCQQPKPVAQFRKDPRYKGGRFCWCRGCVKAYGSSPQKLAKDRARRRRRFADPKVREARNAICRARYATPAGKRKHKDRMYRQNYGTTLVAFETRCAKLESKCEICGRKMKLVPDHNHETGKFRGAICYQCNVGLGALEAMPHLLDKFQKYVQERP
jgi:hypothetical protein